MAEGAELMSRGAEKEEQGLYGGGRGRKGEA